jgi:hypothetical protein
MPTFHDASRRRPLALAACFGMALLVSAARAQNPPPVDRPMPYMQALNRILLLLRDQVRDASRNASTIALTADMEWSTISAKEALPLRSLILSEPEKQAMLAGYRRELIKLIRQELDLEEQLLNNDNAAAAQTLGAIEQTENEGHEKFR